MQKGIEDEEDADGDDHYDNSDEEGDDNCDCDVDDYDNDPALHRDNKDKDHESRFMMICIFHQKINVTQNAIKSNTF